MSKTLRDAAADAIDVMNAAHDANLDGRCEWETREAIRLSVANLRAALAAEQAQPRPVAWMAMRYGVPAQATTDEPTAIRWRNAGGDVRPLIYADDPPPAPVAQPEAKCRSDGRCQYAIDHGAEGMGACPRGKCVMPAPVAQPYASEIARIIRHARNGNMAGVRSYALLLCDKMDAAGHASAKYMRRVVEGDDGELVHPAAPVAQHPSRETLEFIAERVATALHAAGIAVVDDPGEAIEILAAERDSARKRLAEIESAQANNVLEQAAPVAQPAAQQTAVPLSSERKLDLVTNWFAEDHLIKKAMGLLGDYEYAMTHVIGKESGDGR